MKTYSNNNSKSEKAFSWYIEKTIAHFKHLKQRFPSQKNLNAIESVLNDNKRRKINSYYVSAFLLIISGILIIFSSFILSAVLKKEYKNGDKGVSAISEKVSSKDYSSEKCKDSLIVQAKTDTCLVDSLAYTEKGKDKNGANKESNSTTKNIQYCFLMIIWIIPLLIFFRLYNRGFFYREHFRKIDVRLSYLKNFKELEELNIGQISNYIKNESRDELFKKATTPLYEINNQDIIDMIRNLIENELKGKKEQITRIGYLVFELGIITFQDPNVTEGQKLIVWQEVVHNEAAKDQVLIKNPVNIKTDRSKSKIKTEVRDLAKLLINNKWKDGADELYKLLEGMN